MVERWEGKGGLCDKSEEPVVMFVFLPPLMQNERQSLDWQQVTEPHSSRQPMVKSVFYLSELENPILGDRLCVGHN